MATELGGYKLQYNKFTHVSPPSSVIVLADGDYSREAAAYETLQRSSKAQNCIPDYYGSWMIQKILEAETFVYNAGVHHRDMSPRNVMLVSHSDIYTAPDPRIVIIDFNVSNVLDLSARRRGDTDLDAIHKTWPGRMVGPITRFWDELMEFEVKGWVADDIGAANEWLWECFREREDYVPVVRDEDREESPRLVEVEELTGRVSDDDGEDDVVVFRG
ncbi:predicted protein [Pyrenophora tritici-repentis Pt-1C-BFP]|uniref:EKC/KEOPS complex subunit BUD32 n=1 Tax=Pyrenophora tritici-repentis (strain Pt-1C-BFP) TaxID=426418 RepID=B2WPA5_PYRTR|nr:uncharacterized protein PTRG_11815 [Pyrenophora tritici-repentis Pt-1C-BFP]EDU45971.1 predicted protein [Pyrenophora tritici-repentis Pt-1C-BFP]